MQSQKLSQDAIVNELSTKIARLPKGSERQPTLSHGLTELIKDAWMIASVNYAHGEVISLHLVQALLQQNALGVNTLKL